MKNITLKNFIELSEEQIKGLESQDNDLIRDLYLTLINDYNFYQSVQNLITNYQNKIEKENFNYTLALKGFIPSVDRGIKEYINKFCNKNTKVSNLITTKDKIILTSNILDYYIAE